MHTRLVVVVGPCGLTAVEQADDENDESEYTRAPVTAA